MLKTHIRILAVYIGIKKEIKKQIKKIVEEMNNKDIEIISSIKGISKEMAAEFLSEIGDMRRFADKKKLIGYLGIDPVIKQSGKYKGEWHISKRGNKYARRLGFLMAVNVIKYDGRMKEYYAKLRSRGKRHKESVIAVLHELAHYLYLMVIHNKRYDEFIHS